MLQISSAHAAACPCGIWEDDATPTGPAVIDSRPIEVGIKFKSDVAGNIIGIRFYKDPENTGTHFGSLWTATGARLSSARFSGETAEGWQYATFPDPIAIAAHTTYVASYFAPNGHYNASVKYFASQGVDNPPLHAFAELARGGNGAYSLTSQSAFPATSEEGTNYWVDVIFEPRDTPPPPPAPILVLTSPNNLFTQYYGEILQAEGLNEFALADIGTVTPATLANRDLVILGEMPLTSAQVTLLSDWVNAGGNLIAMRPDKKMSGLLGLTDTGSSLKDGYVLISPAGPGLGIVNQTIQFHDVADRYTLNGAIDLATLYSDASTATAHPAVTWRAVGSGHASAFVYDLAKSVVYTRQGYPDYAGRERDGAPPMLIRPDDLFYRDYVNLDKVSIPQADEQQRLLANLITQMNFGHKPLPRFWYLPSGLKAAFIHALDDHNFPAVSGTRETFNKLIAESPPGCVVDDWQCLRATAWTYATIPLTNDEVLAYLSQGFEMGAHVSSLERDFNTPAFTLGDLSDSYTEQIAAYRDKFPSVPAQSTHRYHSTVWSDWLSQAWVMEAHGIRFSLDYYYWPAEWVRGRSGVFNGSGIPMRFADTDGSISDVYQGVSNFVNENGLTYPAAMNTTIEKALGPEGYYGLFGTHDGYDGDPRFLNALVDSAKAHHVPIISAQQALTWLDGRNSSSFGDFSWSDSTLRFTISVGTGARNLRAMVPVNTSSKGLTAITRDGAQVAYTTEIIKGIDYAFFPATPGSYAATYDGPAAPPVLPAGGSTIWPGNAVPANAAVTDPDQIELGLKFKSDRDGRIAGVRFYKGMGDTGTHVAHLWTSTGTLLATGTFLNETSSGWQQVLFTRPVIINADATYVVSYHTDAGRYAASSDYFGAGGVNSPPLHALSDADVAGNGVFSRGPTAFPTNSSHASNYWVDVVFVDIVPKTLWANTATPAIPNVADPGPVELGVKFNTDVDGKIRGIRFYKSSDNAGPHTVTLWASDKSPMGTATSNNETASGWQEVRFKEAVSVKANTTYVASYYAPAGHYSADSHGFANSVDNAPLHALSNGASGGNGVYKYQASGFPELSYNETNYWVDVLFEPND